MNKYKKAFNTIYDTLVYYMVRRDESLLHSDDEIYNAQMVLSKLVDKAEYTTDGKWEVEKIVKLRKCKVVAWMPLPKPYKEKENDDIR